MENAASKTPLPPAGWYQDPEGPTLRYWDGTQWFAAPVNQEDDRPPIDVLAIAALVFGILGALLIAIVLAIVALVRIRKGKSRGKGFAVAALCVCGAWVTVFGVLVGVNLFFNDRTDDSSATDPDRAVIVAAATQFADQVSDGNVADACEFVTPEYNRLQMGTSGRRCTVWLPKLLGTGRYSFEPGSVVNNNDFPGEGPAFATIKSATNALRLRLEYNPDGYWMIGGIDPT